MESTWNTEERQLLKQLRLNAVRNPPAKLEALVTHFKRPNATVFAVTESGEPERNVSKGLAKKVRDYTSAGKLDWVLERAAGSGNQPAQVIHPGEVERYIALEDEEAGVATVEESVSEKVPQALALLRVQTPTSMHGRGLPSTSIRAYTHYWVVKLIMENLSERAVSVGEFILEVSRGDEYHPLPHLGNDTYGSRGGVPMADEALENYVSLTPEKPVLVGVLRFIDDVPFDPGPVNISLKIKGVGTLRGEERMYDLGKHDAR